MAHWQAGWVNEASTKTGQAGWVNVLPMFLLRPHRELTLMARQVQHAIDLSML
jgi:hypothetical protein